MKSDEIYESPEELERIFIRKVIESEPWFFRSGVGIPYTFMYNRSGKAPQRGRLDSYINIGNWASGHLAFCVYSYDTLSAWWFDVASKASRQGLCALHVGEHYWRVPILSDEEFDIRYKNRAEKITYILEILSKYIGRKLNCIYSIRECDMERFAKNLGISDPWTWGKPNYLNSSKRPRMDLPDEVYSL